MDFDQFLEHLKACDRVWFLSSMGQIRATIPAGVEDDFQANCECPITAVYHHVNPGLLRLHVGQWIAAYHIIGLPYDTARDIVAASDCLWHMSDVSRDIRKALINAVSLTSEE